MAGIGTLKTEGRNVTFSRRGVGVYLEVSFKELSHWGRRNRVDANKLYIKSYGAAIRALRAKLQKVVTRGGGVEGVPKFKDFEEFTKELRAVRNNSAPMGGILAEKHVIVSYKRDGAQVIGWPDNLAEWAVKFQDGIGGASSEAMFTDPERRYHLHRLGIRDVPREYVHNPRRVLPEPFDEYVRRHLKEWAHNTYYKALARQMAKKTIATS
jgi:hypothetical protein